MSTLANAIIRKDLPRIQQFLAQGADINQIDEYGFTPLIQSAIVNELAISELLLAKGADVKQTDMVGGTALHWAVENNNFAMAKLLLDHGADPNAYNHNGEPILIKPLLRQHSELKLLLLERGALASFAMDYIHAKLLGHRYDLRGSVDIVSAAGDFVEVSMEGFFLEFSLNLVRYSLEEYTKNYAARHAKDAFPLLSQAIHALKIAGQLMPYVQYQVNLAEHKAAINQLLDQECLIIPTTYAGHAITFIYYQDLLIRCDRRKMGQALNGVNVFKIHNRAAMTKELIHYLIFEKKEPEFIEKEMIALLGLELQTRILLSPQMSGNCSWANVVACVPAFVYLQGIVHNPAAAMEIVDIDHPAIVTYRHWRDWDRMRALHYFINAFDGASRKRKASIASLLGAVMFQRFHHADQSIIPLAKRILKILRTERYDYILQNYLDFYYITRRTAAGDNFKKLIDICDSYL